MTATEDLLRDALHARADAARHLPTPASAVAARARVHRRRTRLAGSVVAVAATAAVAVPVALTVGDGPAGDRDLPAAGSRTLTLGDAADLPRGAPPAVDHVRDRTYVFATGGSLDLPAPEGGLLDAAPYLGGVLAVTADPGTDPAAGQGAGTLTLVDRDGSTRWTRCGSDVVVSLDGSTTGFGWDEAGCDAAWERPRLEWGPAYAEGGTRGGPLEPGRTVTAVAVAPDALVYGVEAGPGGPARVEVVRGRSGPVTVPGLAFATAADLDAGLVAGCTPDDGCGVYTEAGDAVLALEDAAESPVALSPDGTLVATATVGDDQVLRVREVDGGEVLLTVSAAGGFRGDLAWEDDAHLLLARVDRTGEALVRIGLDGSLEAATPVAAPTLGGYLLPTS